MARTAQTDTARFRPVWHKTTFRDHAGRTAIRLRLSTRDNGIPADFKKHPVFPIQVYATVPIATSASDQPEPSGNDSGQSSTKRSRGENDADTSMTQDLESLCAWLGDDLSDSQRPAPVWEIYEQQPDALACLDHQRREIAYRKAHADAIDTLLIPTLSKTAASDQRHTGFLIVVESDFYKIKPSLNELDDAVNENGPLWVRFRRPLPLVGPEHLRLKSTVFTIAQQLEVEDEQLPERFEVEVEHKQKVRDMQDELRAIYAESCAPDEENEGVAELNTGLNIDENVIVSAAGDGEAASGDPDPIEQLAEALSLDDFSVTSTNDTVTVTNGNGTTATVSYVVYVLPGGAASLNATAKAFTHAITSHLGSSSVKFEFRQPPRAALSSVLDHYRGSDPSPDGVGALNDGRRRHPIARQPGSRQDNPDTCDFEPYRTFLVIIDRVTDFTKDISGVLFLLADGGKQKLDPSDENCIYSGPTFDYVQTAVWRCQQNVENLAKRLAMQNTKAAGTET